MKKIIVVIALIVGCLSCFGGNWKTIEDENIQGLSLVGKDNSIFSVMKFNGENSCQIGLVINNLNKIRKSDFIDVYVDGVRFRIGDVIILKGEYVVGIISGKQMLKIIEAKKRIRVKYSEHTFEFVP